MGIPEDENMRPWFYTWSLLSRLFPDGSKTLGSDLGADITGRVRTIRNGRVL